MPDDSTVAAATTAPPLASAPLPPSPSFVPTTPFALIWDQVCRHGALRLSGIVGLALAGALVDNLQPYALGVLVNALAAIPVTGVAGEGAWAEKPSPPYFFGMIMPKKRFCLMKAYTFGGRSCHS